MDLILDFGFAWISVILCILLSVIYILRKLLRKHKKEGTLKNLNKFLRKHHKALGITLILTGLIHGLSSSRSILSINLGTVCWLISILLGINYMLRSYLQNIKGWLFYHRILTIAFIAVLVLHIYNVGIQAPRLLADAIISKHTDYNEGNSENDSDIKNEAETNGSANNNDTSTNGNIVNNDISANGSISNNDTSASGSIANNDTSASGSSNNDTSTDSNNANTSDNEAATDSKQMEGLELKDGTYEGEASGFGGVLTVSVVIKDNAIESIDIVSHNERNSRIYSGAMEQVPQEIIDNQSLSVDTVSGATFTSTGIINAVKNALSKALISGTLPEDLALPFGRRH